MDNEREIKAGQLAWWLCETSLMVDQVKVGERIHADGVTRKCAYPRDGEYTHFTKEIDEFDLFSDRRDALIAQVGRCNHDVAIANLRKEAAEKELAGD